MLSRRSLLLSVAAAAASGAAITPTLAASQLPFDAKSFAELQKAGKPIFVAIHATWCPICAVQRPILSILMADPKFKDLLFRGRFRQPEGRGEVFRSARAVDADRVQRRNGNGPLRRRNRACLDRSALEQDALSGQ